MLGTGHSRKLCCYVGGTGENRRWQTTTSRKRLSYGNIGGKAPAIIDMAQ
jgi:hypothetical protein